MPDVTTLRSRPALTWLVFLVFAALSVALGLAIASGSTGRVSVEALLPALIVVAAALIASNRAILIFGALALDLSGYLPLRKPLIGGHVFAADLIVLLALGTWAAAWLIAPGWRRPSWPKTVLLGWPLLIFAIFIGSGVIRGHQLWGESYVSQPVRFVLYAGIAAAIVDLKPRQAWQGIVTVFYLGAVWNAIAAAYYRATGTVQQDAAGWNLSTGGHRVLTLTTGLYLTGALLVALLELEREHRAGRRMLHILVGALAVAGILVSYGRGVFLSAAAVMIALVLTRPRLRKGALAVAPLCIPFIVLIGLILVRTDPGFASGITHRALALNSTDPSIQWRQGAVAAIWAQVRENPIFGVGFGKGASFTVDFARFNITQDPHNSYLFLWAGGGILALGSFILLFLIYLRDSWRRYRSQAEVPQVLIVWCVSFWACIALNTLIEPQLTQPNSLLVLWILMLMPTIVSYAKRGEGDALVT